MSPELALQLMTQVLVTSLLVCAPLLAATMLVGLLISVVQVVTQVQEMSLTFVPKIATAALVLIAFGPWMLRQLVSVAASLINNIPRYL